MMTTLKFPRIFAALAAFAVGLTVGLLVLKHAHVRHPPARHVPTAPVAAAAQDPLDTPGNPVVAVVNDSQIHKSDLSALSPPAAPQEARALLVDFALLDQAARRKHVKVSAADMQQQRRQVMGSRTGKTYADVARSLGRTPSGLDLQLRHVVLLYKLAALKSSFPIGRMIHARGILVKADGKHAKSASQARAYAARLQEQVQGGADIAALARADSDDAQSASNGGDFGIIQLAGAPNLVRFAPDFKLQVALTHVVKTAAASRVLPGPIHGDAGYWVVKIVSTSDRPGGDRPEYRQVQAMWQQMWIGREEPVVMSSLRSRATIEPEVATDPQPAQATSSPPGGLLGAAPGG